MALVKEYQTSIEESKGAHDHPRETYLCFYNSELNMITTSNYYLDSFYRPLLHGDIFGR